MNWGPYATQGEASFYLGQFADAAAGAGMGLIWSDGSGCMLLRKPQYDADGYGYSLIVEWRGGLGPPPQPKAPTALQRVAKFFNDAMTAYGEAEIANSEAELAMGRAVGDWLSDKDNEHAVSLAFDILGIVCAITLFIPIVGEVEMGVGAVAEGGMALARAARVTGALAGVGASLGATVDGTYLGVRYFEGTQAAKEWDDSPAAVTMSLAAAILALPDFAVGGVMLVKDLGRLGTASSVAREISDGYRSTSVAKAQKAQSLLDRIPEEPAWKAKHLIRKSGQISARAEKLAKRAGEAADRAVRIQHKIYALMLLNAPSTFVGAPTAEAYFVHDNPHPSEPLHTASQWIGSLLVPEKLAADARNIVHNFALRIGISSRTQSGAQ